MPLPLIPIAVGALAGTAWLVQGRRAKSQSNPARDAERAAIFDVAMNSKADPDAIRNLAAAFRKEGFKAEAEMLEKRAALAEAPPEVKAQRTAVFRHALTSQDPKAVREVADAFDSLGAVGAAAKLRTYADGLEAAKTSTIAGSHD